jgi:putative ABC transport system permease protein
MLRRLFRKKRAEHDIDCELRAYADQLADERIAGGANPEEARRAAWAALGGITQIKEEIREARGIAMFEQLLQDLRYGARALRKSPAFTGAAILALALGIGVNTAMFSVLYGLLLRPMPYPQSERVAVVFMRYAPRDFAFGTMCMRDFLMWRDENHAFEEPSLFRLLRMDVGSKEAPPEQVQGAAVTAGFFPALATRPLIGRTFVTGEDRPGGPSLAVLSESIWRRRFSGRRSILGESIVINGAAATVIGVMPQDFSFPARNGEVWTNLALTPPTRYGPWFYRGVARLKPGVTLAQAHAELDRIGARMMQQNSYYKRLALPALPLRDAIVGANLKPAILALAGAVGLVLLIAVVNVANLMLARATIREREMALRLSIGAGRGRLVRQLLTESILLAAIGGAAGLTLAWGAIELLRVSNPGNFPLIDSVRLDGAAFAFMLAAVAFTGILFGLAPALECARTDLSGSLKEGGRGGASGRARARMRSALVVAEIALSLMLLAGAGLLIRSFANLERVTGGFSTPPRQLLSVLVSLSSARYRDDAVARAYYDEALRRARAVPGVAAAAVADSLPPDRQGDADTFELEGKPLAPGQINPIVSDATVSPGYFEAMGIPLLAGRDFDAYDLPGSQQVAIVSRGFAQRFLPGENPLGKRIKQSGPGFGDHWMQIVGVVGNVKFLGLAADTEAAYYMPHAQSGGSRLFLVVRAKGDAAAFAGPIRSAVQSIDPEVTLAQTSTMEEALDQSITLPRFDAALLALFAGIALALAAVGIYGLIAYSVAQRTREIGVRMALGANRRQVVAMILRQAIVLAAMGVALGLAGAIGLSRFLETMLFGVGTTDAVTFAGAAGLLILMALAATFAPARRATQISPVEALRYE